jgi:hypothetical protein
VKSKLVVAIFAILFVGSMSTAAVALTSSDDDARPGHSKTKADKGDHAKGPKSDRGHAPPWAHHGKGGKPDQAWKDAWQKLTPAQRAARMAELAQQHADGMKKWAECVKSAGDDAAARAKCTKPLPPGLAKKQPAG